MEDKSPTDRLKIALNEITIAREDERTPEWETNKLEELGGEIWEVWHDLSVKLNSNND